MDPAHSPPSSSSSRRSTPGSQRRCLRAPGRTRSPAPGRTRPPPLGQTSSRAPIRPPRSRPTIASGRSPRPLPSTTSGPRRPTRPRPGTARAPTAPARSRSSTRSCSSPRPIRTRPRICAPGTAFAPTRRRTWAWPTTRCRARSPRTTRSSSAPSTRPKDAEYDSIVIPDYDCDVSRWSAAEVEEERRVVYVGVTRARDAALFTVDSSSGFVHPFLRELVEEPDPGEHDALRAWLAEEPAGELPRAHRRPARGDRGAVPGARSGAGSAGRRGGRPGGQRRERSAPVAAP